jgi:hypothetical protein
MINTAKGKIQNFPKKKIPNSNRGNYAGLKAFDLATDLKKMFLGF